jgi:hypothetical protein
MTLFASTIMQEQMRMLTVKTECCSIPFISAKWGDEILAEAQSMEIRE